MFRFNDIYYQQKKWTLLDHFMVKMGKNTAQTTEIGTRVCFRISPNRQHGSYLAPQLVRNYIFWRIVWSLRLDSSLFSLLNSETCWDEGINVIGACLTYNAAVARVATARNAMRGASQTPPTSPRTKLFSGPKLGYTCIHKKIRVHLYS